LVGLETGLAEAGAAVEFPSVPWTDDVILIEMTVAERPADMIARIRQRPLVLRDSRAQVFEGFCL
jgi:hypothetical protein